MIIIYSSVVYKLYSVAYLVLLRYQSSYRESCSFTGIVIDYWNISIISQLYCSLLHKKA